MNDWIRGIKKGLPIAIGYLSVSFTFGVKAVNAGIPVWITILISVANVTSAGQFAGVAIMAAHGSYLEMAMTTFIINVRYMLMSFSLSQKVDKKMTLRQRLMIGYGITDEIFAVSSMETESLSARFMYGYGAGLWMDSWYRSRGTCVSDYAGGFISCDGTWSVCDVYCNYHTAGKKEQGRFICYWYCCYLPVYFYCDTGTQRNFHWLSGDSFYRDCSIYRSVYVPGKKGG